jgi:hypothetical protein
VDAGGGVGVDAGGGVGVGVGGGVGVGVGADEPVINITLTFDAPYKDTLFPSVNPNLDNNDTDDRYNVNNPALLYCIGETGANTGEL